MDGRTDKSKAGKILRWHVENHLSIVRILDTCMFVLFHIYYNFVDGAGNRVGNTHNKLFLHWQSRSYSNTNFDKSILDRVKSNL